MKPASSALQVEAEAKRSSGRWVMVRPLPMPTAELSGVRVTQICMGRAQPHKGLHFDPAVRLRAVRGPATGACTSHAACPRASGRRRRTGSCSAVCSTTAVGPRSSAPVSSAGAGACSVVRGSSSPARFQACSRSGSYGSRGERKRPGAYRTRESLGRRVRGAKGESRSRTLENDGGASSLRAPTRLSMI